jgi:hypothetical protein
MNRFLAGSFTRIAPVVLGMALYSGCGDSGTSTPTIATQDDAAAAYSALAAKLGQCQDDHDACVAAAAGDATKVKACDTAAESCKAQTKGDEDRAKNGLKRAAAGCRHDDDDAGVDGRGKGRGREECRHCMEGRHAAPNSPCFEDLLTCLQDKAGPGPNQNTALNMCVDAAHTCMMDNMPRHGSGEPGHHPEAGSSGHEPRAGAAGGDDHRGPGRFPGRGEAGGGEPHNRGGAAGEEHHRAGAGGHEPPRFPGRGPRAGAGGS